MLVKKNIFEDIKSKDASTNITESNKEIFEDLLKNENLKLERIISYPNSIPGDKWYDQNKDEWVILLKGSAALQFENDELIKLLPGDYLFIPSHLKHKVKEVNKNEPTIWLALNFESK
ncbi:MAG: cupin domain-containing protein [Bacteroidetes bacterium]|nr:cupin domain-containing protein [Bacteroidota bacterium]